MTGSPEPGGPRGSSAGAHADLGTDDARVGRRRPWWRDAVVYEVYIRSFADGDGDGVGDVAGLRSRLPYLADLGVDAIWITPWYPSPLADGGYDIADHRAVDPRLGDLTGADHLVTDAHALGLRVLLDLVPNHTSHRHRWFRAALADPAAPERDRYLFRPGREGGAAPPNNWRSVFGGPAWTRVPDPDGRPGDWYLHLFSPQQPDLDWSADAVRDEFVATLRFWFDRGIDGFRIDVAQALTKHPELPDVADPTAVHAAELELTGAHPYWDRDEVHDIYRSWRAVADRYDPPRTFIAEAWVGDAGRLVRYLRPDELHLAFEFDLLEAPWTAHAQRRAIDRALEGHARAGTTPTWVLSNHDVARHVSRYARDQRALTGPDLDDFAHLPADLDIGVRRARAAILLILALPGVATLYQGEELGLPEVEDLPVDALTDPTWERSGHTVRGRDGCRVPLPWTVDGRSFGFGPAGGASPWLPQPDDWGARSVQAQDGDDTSMLALYRAALALRRELAPPADAAVTWTPTGDGVLHFTRGSFGCLVNIDADAVAPPAGARVLLSSAPLDDGGRLPRAAAAWVDTAG